MVGRAAELGGWWVYCGGDGVGADVCGSNAADISGPARLDGATQCVQSFETIEDSWRKVTQQIGPPDSRTCRNGNSGCGHHCDQATMNNNWYRIPRAAQ